MDVAEKIVEFIKIKGPVIPVNVAKEINTDILIASAHLSRLVEEKKLKISHLKVGGSPLYYLPGQEAMLQNFVSNLHEKEKEAYDLILQKKVLKDKELEPAIRVALRNIKNFAIPLEINYNRSREVYWKWYLTSNEEVENLIKGLIEPKKELIKRVDQIEEKKTLETKSIEKEERPLEQKTLKKPIKKPRLISDNFPDTIYNYLNKKEIKIIEKDMIKKGEIDFIINLPSAVGDLIYYCKAKNKKTINDADLNAVYVHAQSRKMPALILTTGNLTKKAKEMLEKEFKGMVVKKI